MEERRKGDQLISRLWDDVKGINNRLDRIIERNDEEHDVLKGKIHRVENRMTRMEAISAFVGAIGTTVAGWFGFNGK